MSFSICHKCSLIFVVVCIANFLVGAGSLSFASNEADDSPIEITLFLFTNDIHSEGKGEMIGKLDQSKHVTLIAPPGKERASYYKSMPSQIGILEVLLGSIFRNPKLKNIHIQLCILDWSHKPEDLQRILDETEGPFIVQVPSTWRYSVSDKLNPLSKRMSQIKGDQEGLSNVKDNSGEGVNKTLVPWLCDFRFMATYLKPSRDSNMKYPNLHIHIDPDKAIESIISSKLILSGWPIEQDNEQNLLHSIKPFSGIDIHAEAFTQKHIDNLLDFFKKTMLRPGLWKDVPIKTFMQGQKEFLENLENADGKDSFVTFADGYLIRELIKRLYVNDSVDIFDGLTFLLFGKNAFVGGSFLGMHWTPGDKKEKEAVERLVELFLENANKYASYTTMLPADVTQIDGYFANTLREKKKSEIKLTTERNSVEKIDSPENRMKKAVRQMYNNMAIDYPPAFLRAHTEIEVARALAEAIKKAQKEGGDEQAFNDVLKKLLKTPQQDQQSFLIPVGLSVLGIAVIAGMYWLKKCWCLRRNRKIIDDLLKEKNISEQNFFPAINQIRCTLVDRDLTIFEKDRLYQFLSKLNGILSQNDKGLDLLDIISNKNDCYIRFQSDGVIKNRSKLANIEIESSGGYEYAFIS